MTKSEMLVVAFQGELGAFSHMAVLEFFNNKVRLLPRPSLQEVFSSLSQNADLAVVPIENSRSGDIGETIDLLFSHNYTITGEVILPVRQCLIIHKDSEVAKIRKITSHPQALMQCTKFLTSFGKDWQRIPAYDTAGAVKTIAEERLIDTAAIASHFASRIYGMKVVKEGIEDDPGNMTRFIVVASNKTSEYPELNMQYKTSLIFLTEHKPGSLVSALRCLSDRGINLLKIVSRPIQGKSWEYLFYVEFQGSTNDTNCSEAIEELKSRSIKVKMLGSYLSYQRSL